MITQITTNLSFSVWRPFWDNYHNVMYMMLLGYVLHMIPERFADHYVRPVLERTPMVAYLVMFAGFVIIYAQFKASTPVMPIYLQF
jgi:alginate O-acetyltransferase complex protein AlgI